LFELDQNDVDKVLMTSHENQYKRFIDTILVRVLEKTPEDLKKDQKWDEAEDARLFRDQKQEEKIMKLIHQLNGMPYFRVHVPT
jgi:DNA topoisomerase VI subunit B